MPKVRMDIEDDLYQKYKDLVNEMGMKITVLNKSLLEEAIKKWIKEAKET